MEGSGICVRNRAAFQLELMVMKGEKAGDVSKTETENRFAGLP